MCIRDRPSPEERESQLETLQLVDSMLDGLNGKTREAFLLSQLDGLTSVSYTHLDVYKRQSYAHDTKMTKAEMSESVCIT